MRFLFISILAAALTANPVRAEDRGGMFERMKGSVFTVEVSSGSGGTKDVLGSGYLATADSRIITNYHVTGNFIDDPERYLIRVKNHTGVYEARLLNFDLINDLALLEAPSVNGEPAILAKENPPMGSSIVSLGNPEGFGLSLIEGIFNGFAEKGFVDRLMLSMPLNAGMSGGPILNAEGEVIGTNVSVIWLANSLSFGVPVSKVLALLDAPPLKISKVSLLSEIDRQLKVLEEEASTRAVNAYTKPVKSGDIAVGSVISREPPPLFDCWNRTDLHKDEGITKRRYGCNLQFTPQAETIGEVGSVELLIEHFESKESRYGFYSFLEDHGPKHHDVSAQHPANGVFSAPICTVDRVASGGLEWKVNTCLNAYVKHPGLFNFDLVATSLSYAREAAYVALHMKGFGVDSFLSFSKTLLESTRIREER